jgi:hypothetical protein
MLEGGREAGKDRERSLLNRESALLLHNKNNTVRRKAMGGVIHGSLNQQKAARKKMPYYL